MGAVACSGEAYCHARQRLPLQVLQRLLHALSQYLGGSAMLDDGRWHGHRTFLVDGSGVSMPDTPALQAAFGQPGMQRPSTMMTSNRPLEDWGKRLGDVPSATAILDRFLHHAVIITIIGKSYRLRTAASNRDGAPEKRMESETTDEPESPPPPESAVGAGQTAVGLGAHHAKPTKEAKPAPKSSKESRKITATA